MKKGAVYYIQYITDVKIFLKKRIEPAFLFFISLDAKLAIAITANFVNRWSSEEQAVQEIGGISRLALKGLYHERMGNRSSSKKEAVQETGASAR
jgi:hypothetical protein